MKKKIDVNAPHCINITPTAPCGAITIFSLTFFTCATDHAKKEGLLVVYNAYKCRDHHFFQVLRKLILIHLILQRLKYFRTQTRANARNLNSQSEQPFHSLQWLSIY